MFYHSVLDGFLWHQSSVYLFFSLLEIEVQVSHLISFTTWDRGNPITARGVWEFQSTMYFSLITQCEWPHYCLGDSESPDPPLDFCWLHPNEEWEEHLITVDLCGSLSSPYGFHIHWHGDWPDYHRWGAQKSQAHWILCYEHRGAYDLSDWYFWVLGIYS